MALLFAAEWGVRQQVKARMNSHAATAVRAASLQLKDAND